MLYEMTTGRLPFVADNAVSVALMQLQAKPVMPRELNPNLPRGLEQITMRAMEKNPVDRFQSAGEMLDDMDRFRRNPSVVFHYDLQAGRVDYDTSRNIDSYDSARFKPSYNDSYEYEEEYVRSQRGARGAMAVKGVIAAAIIVLLAVGAVWLWNNSDPLFEPKEDEQIEMPNFVGMIYDDILSDPTYSENFKFKRTEGNNPDLQPGEVMQQNPNSKIMVKKGSEVTLMVNGKVEQVEVPDMEDYTQADAIALLKELELKVKCEDVAHDEIKVGHVVASDPQAKSMVDVGTTITLKISKGPATKKVDIPGDLVGKTRYDVEALLKERKLVIGNVTSDDTSTQPADTVVSTNPAPGSKVSEGATVDIVISSGKGSTKTISKDIQLPSGVNMDLNLKVYKNGTLVDERTVNPAYSGSYNLTYTGTSGQESVVVQLEGKDYMYLTFDYDAKEATITQTFEFNPPSSSGGEPDNSGSGDSSYEDGMGTGGGGITN